MRAVVWTGDQDFHLQDVPEPEPTDDQILVKVEAAAICGTDFHYADFQSRPPIIPGHEVAGTVVEVGSKVPQFSAGDSVTLDPVQRCGKCYPCTHGIEHLCSNVRHLGGNVPLAVGQSLLPLTPPTHIAFPTVFRSRQQLWQNQARSATKVCDGPPCKPARRCWSSATAPSDSCTRPLPVFSEQARS